jgi:HlyD family secretion protein
MKKTLLSTAYCYCLLPTVYCLLATACSGNGGKADAYGNFEAREITVSAQGSGQILWFKAEEGLLLKAGDVVGLIDTSDLHLNKLQLDAQYAATKAQFTVLQAQAGVQRQQIANLEKDRQRIANMLTDGAATQKQYDDIQSGIDMASRQIEVINSQRNELQSRLDAVGAQIAQASHSISKCIITNPQDGVVLTKYCEAGEVAAAGRALYKIGEVQHIKLKAYVGETQLSSIRLGQPVSVSVDAEDGSLRTFDGEIIWISDRAEFTPKIIQTRDERINLVYAIKVLVPNDGSLKIGMPGEVRF